MVLTGYFSLLRSKHLFIVAYIILVESVLVGVWGFPDFPEGLYGIFFLCCFVVFFLRYFFASILTSN
jgi:hypothetical protein